MWTLIILYLYTYDIVYPNVFQVVCIAGGVLEVIILRISIVPLVVYQSPLLSLP